MRKSLIASVIGRYGILILQIATSMVLARLLTPAEMGVWGVGQSAIFLSSTLRDFGAGDYLVRSGEIGKRSIGQVLGLMLVISLVCAAILWLSRGFLAEFFREPRLAGLIEIMTLTYLLMPFGLGALVVMEREFAFVQMQFMQAAAIIAGSLTCIVLAIQGYSFFSLAWGQLVQMAVLLGLRAMARPAAFFCRPIFSGWSHILNFGIFTTLTAIVNQISLQAVTAMIGRMLGLSPLGLYERANGMNGYISSDLTFSIMQVVYVGFSKVREKPAELGRLYLATVENLTGVLWPAYCLMALLAPQIILVLYGPRWEAAAPLLQIICMGSLLHVLYAPQVRILTSFCHVRTILGVESAVVACRVAGVLLLAPFGLAWAVVGVTLPSLVAFLLYGLAFPRLPLPPRALIQAVGRSGLLLLATLLPAALLLYLSPMSRMPALLQLASCLLLAALCWLGAVRAVSHSLRPEVALVMSHCVRMARQLAGQPAASGGAPEILR